MSGGKVGTMRNGSMLSAGMVVTDGTPLRALLRELEALKGRRDFCDPDAPFIELLDEMSDAIGHPVTCGGSSYRDHECGEFDIWVGPEEKCIARRACDVDIQGAIYQFAVARAQSGHKHKAVQVSPRGKVDSAYVECDCGHIEAVGTWWSSEPQGWDRGQWPVVIEAVDRVARRGRGEAIAI